jgi:ABC-type nickel/cobalt efflux system permease component RcnA
MVLSCASQQKIENAQVQSIIHALIFLIGSSSLFRGRTRNNHLPNQPFQENQEHQEAAAHHTKQAKQPHKATARHQPHHTQQKKNPN